jgi:hypothetical protein
MLGSTILSFVHTLGSCQSVFASSPLHVDSGGEEPTTGDPVQHGCTFLLNLGRILRQHPVQGSWAGPLAALCGLLGYQGAGPGGRQTRSR